MDYKSNLYDRFIKQARIAAQDSNLSLDEFLDGLEFKAHYTRDDSPDLFPCTCLCGEKLTAEAFQFDDISNLRSYILGKVCSKSLDREFARLAVVAELGSYLSRPDKRKYEVIPEKLWRQIRGLELWEARVLSPKIKANIRNLTESCKFPWDMDTVFAEGICVAYGIIPKGVVLVYFDRAGDIW